MSQWGGRNQVSQAWWLPLATVSASKESEEKGDVAWKTVDTRKAVATAFAAAEAQEAGTVSDSSDGWETISEGSVTDSKLISRSITDAQTRHDRARSIEARRRTEAEDEHFKNRTGCYSWGPQGEMGPRWGSSYTGD